MKDSFLKIFIKNEGTLSPAERKAAYGTFSGTVGIIANVFLSGFKFAVGALSGSASIIADAANNLSDMLTSVISLIGFKLAKKPADEAHPFGHGRYEYILSVIVSFFVLFMGVELLKNGIEKIISPAAVSVSPFVIVVLAVSIVVKIGIGMLNLYLARRADVIALKAVAKDSFGDCISTAAVLISIVLQKIFHLPFDGYVAAAVSLLVLWSGIDILRESLSPLLGKPAGKETVKELKQFMLSFDPDILDVHDMMFHDYGMGRIFAVAHAEVPAERELVVIHETVDALEKAVEETFGIYLVVHMDPVKANDTKTKSLRDNVLTVVKSIDEHYTIHDFRLSEDGKKMYFDLVIDSDIKKEAAQIGEMVSQRILAVLGDSIEPQIHVEFSFEQQ
ncbi:MAG: cation diffusion facilitator family transporter [Clostridia bacterium]|nr:cation diffusion facilitator family transporter [Clostridia bacterium]